MALSTRSDMTIKRVVLTGMANWKQRAVDPVRLMNAEEMVLGLLSSQCIDEFIQIPAYQHSRLEQYLNDVDHLLH